VRPAPATGKPESCAARYIEARLRDVPVLVPLAPVLEVIPVPRLSRVPGAPDWVGGVAHARGKVLCVVDLGLFFGSTPVVRRRRTRLLVVEHGPGLLGFEVDEVLGVERAPEPLPPELGFGRGQWLSRSEEDSAGLAPASGGRLDLDAVRALPELSPPPR